jgi:hypothetical protein
VREKQKTTKKNRKTLPVKDSAIKTTFEMEWRP